MIINQFIKAAGEGNLQELDRIVSMNPEQIQNMVSARDYFAFREAVFHGHLAVIEKLVKLAPERVHDMVGAKNFLAFQLAAHNGHLAVLDKLITILPGKVLDMVSANNFYAFQLAAQKGHLAVMDKLINIASKNIYEMMSADNFAAFSGAAAHGQLGVMEKLMELAPDKVHDMVCARDYHAFRKAAHNGHLATIKKLIDLAPDNIQDMVSAENFYAFQFAASHGHLDVMEKLMEIASDKVQDMVSADNFYAFEMAHENAQLQIVERLLSVPAVFTYAEMHPHEYREFVQDFMNFELSTLSQDTNNFNTNHPGQVFDITDLEKAKLYFYMLRPLIRQQTPESLNQISLLLDIPSVRALAHQEITPNEPNELLRLAMSLNHQAAAHRLLAIPAVYELAVRNDFYQQEQRHGLDLRALAQNRESSMTALTQGEQNTLKAVETIYKPIIDTRGAAAIMNELRHDIATRYQANPATVQTGDGREIELPLEYKDYQNLAKTFSADTRERALKSYYEAPVHTAYRYLSKPNPWMATNAQFVHRTSEGAWSTFEGYQDLISLLYLAAKDNNTPSINDYSIEDRIHHFIRELADIGRAHNWDKTRINRSRGVSEEYDDLEGDKPSCHAGVKRRLFQSVKGHPLLIILTENLIKQEAREMVREHFKNAINETNYESLQQAWQSVIDREVDNDNRDILKQLDLSEEQVQSMLDTLHKKYGPRFDEYFQAYFLGLIQSPKNIKSLAEYQGFQFHLPKILEQKAEEFQARPLSPEEMRAARLRFFEKQASKNSLDETKDQEIHKKNHKRI